MSGLQAAGGKSEDDSGALQKGLDAEFADLQLGDGFFQDFLGESAKVSDLSFSIDRLVHGLVSSPRFLRAFLRARVFAGTLSAGGGSCQITSTPTSSNASADESDASSSILYGSIPVGNKTPTVSGFCPDTHTLLDPSTCPAPLFYPGVTKRDLKFGGLLDRWREVVRSCIREQGLPPRDLRGLFVGISAIFYAAKACGCAEKILPKRAFLGFLEAELERLFEGTVPVGSGAEEDGEKSMALTGKELQLFSNLALVHTFVEVVLHDTAYIVTKRNWKYDAEAADATCMGAAGSEFVATWSFGFWLVAAGLDGGIAAEKTA